MKKIINLSFFHSGYNDTAIFFLHVVYSNLHVINGLFLGVIWGHSMKVILTIYK